MHDLDSWLPAEVKVYLEQKHGAIYPVIKITTGTGIEDDLFTLTLDEAGELGALLTVAASKARRAALDAREAAGKVAAS